MRKTKILSCVSLWIIKHVLLLLKHYYVKYAYVISCKDNREISRRDPSFERTLGKHSIFLVDKMNSLPSYYQQNKRRSISSYIRPFYWCFRFENVISLRVDGKVTEIKFYDGSVPNLYSDNGIEISIGGSRSAPYKYDIRRKGVVDNNPVGTKRERKVPPAPLIKPTQEQESTSHQLVFNEENIAARKTAEEKLRAMVSELSEANNTNNDFTEEESFIIDCIKENGGAIGIEELRKKVKESYNDIWIESKIDEINDKYWNKTRSTLVNSNEHFFYLTNNK